MKWLIGILFACWLAPVILAQTTATISLDMNGTLSWANAYTNGLLTIERSTSLSANIWLPFRNILTSNENISGSTTLPLTNVPVFYRAIIADTSTNPSGMRLIPEGYFQMGDHYATSGSAIPLHNVYISSFYIDQFEFTNQRLRDAYQWAYDNGRLHTTDFRVIKTKVAISNLALIDLHRPEYDPTNSVRYWGGLSFTNGLFSLVEGRENQPCINISWFGAAAACNFLSEMEGLEPCYDMSVSNYPCDFSKNGYRLPTEAEWEKAARGGMTGHHYPWHSYGGSYTLHINQGMANYTPPTDPHPFNMKPVGYFNGEQTPAGPDMINGYGLYDMAGNTREWCYDWYSSFWYFDPAAFLPNPTGPAASSSSPATRTQRGGSFDLGPSQLRVGLRDFQIPMFSTAGTWYNGFRLVRSKL